MIDVNKIGDLIRRQSIEKIWMWILVFVYVGFLLIYHKWGDYESEAWSKAYYIWDCTVHLLALINISTRNKQLFYLLYPLMCYAGLRLMIEIATIYEPMKEANDPFVVDILLYMCSAAFGLLIIKNRVDEYFNHQ
jgi:hypothetical protein